MIDDGGHGIDEAVKKSMCALSCCLYLLFIPFCCIVVGVNVHFGLMHGAAWYMIA
jgi:hypothetical protein